MESQEIGLPSICFGSSLEATLPQLPQYLQLFAPSPVPHLPSFLPSGAPLFPSHYGGVSHQTAAFTCRPKFPLAVQKCWAGCQQSAQ